jgi:hypothetical protein
MKYYLIALAVLERAVATANTKVEDLKNAYNKAVEKSATELKAFFSTKEPLFSGSKVLPVNFFGTIVRAAELGIPETTEKIEQRVARELEDLKEIQTTGISVPTNFAVDPKVPTSPTLRRKILAFLVAETPRTISVARVFANVHQWAQDPEGYPLPETLKVPVAGLRQYFAARLAGLSSTEEHFYVADTTFSVQDVSAKILADAPVEKAKVGDIYSSDAGILTRNPAATSTLLTLFPKAKTGWDAAVANASAADKGTVEVTRDQLVLLASIPAPDLVVSEVTFSTK